MILDKTIRVHQDVYSLIILLWIALDKDTIEERDDFFASVYQTKIYAFSYYVVI